MLVHRKFEIIHRSSIARKSSGAPQPRSGRESGLSGWRAGGAGRIDKMFI
jgi:hypothetical protein